MISVVVLGYGNLAFHLINAFSSAEDVALKQVYARDINSIKHLKGSTDITDSIKHLKDADVYIIAVSDGAIQPLSSTLTAKTGLVVHTSGSVTMEALKSKGRKGIFYPLQSFSKTKSVNFETIPFCLEANDDNDLTTLERLAQAIGTTTYRINSTQRQRLHVAAVFVNNFVNHLYKIGNDICEGYDVPFDILKPLIMETASKINYLSPELAQTGPAKRHDESTIKAHLELLNTHQKGIYELLTKSIQNGEKL